jgi:hypothetical protein
MAALVHAPGDLVPDWRRGLERALRAAGLLAPEVVPPEAWRRAVRVSTLDLAAAEAAFMPEGVAWLDGRTFAIGDPDRGRVARVLADAAGLTVLGIERADPPAAIRRVGVPNGPALVVEIAGRRLVRCGPGDAPPIALLDEVPAVAPVALAVGPQGDLVLVDAASQRVCLLRLTR